MNKALSREVEGLSPMKPGNRPSAAVPIPAGYILEDEESNIKPLRPKRLYS
jgi:hypothetical protein